MTAGQAFLLVVAAFAAGVMNAMAGGGTILTFPALVLVGLPAIAANATSTVALLPGTVASFLGYRDELREQRHWFRRLLVPSLVGGAIGSVLLLRTPERTFALLAPFLVLFATLLFILQGLVSRRAKSGFVTAGSGDEPASGRWALAALLQLCVAIYGGYFGAGIGILMLALLGWLGVANIHAANGLKNFFGFCINSVAAVYFIAQGAVVWPAALLVVIGATVGGYSGARFARRIGREKARAAVVVIGLLVTAILFLQAVRPAAVG
ncbi:MAG TPA: sulfite exporter TauE/SafE family protein [Thermoanaerobaculia bacterium]|nr:sulfite exporter TauE/SafE family protein [Thermoanaerobaculia bacterium]